MNTRVIFKHKIIPPPKTKNQAIHLNTLCERDTPLSSKVAKHNSKCNRRNGWKIVKAKFVNTYCSNSILNDNDLQYCNIVHYNQYYEHCTRAYAFTRSIFNIINSPHHLVRMYLSLSTQSSRNKLLATRDTTALF